MAEHGTGLQGSAGEIAAEAEGQADATRHRNKSNQTGPAMDEKSARDPAASPGATPTMSRLQQLRREHQEQLAGGMPHSAYYTGPPGQDSVFGTAPCGVIGRDLPRAIVRIERDYTGGELCQFHPTFPLELERRIAPVVFSETINDLNVIIIEANHAGWACLDNVLAVLSLYTTPLIFGTRYQKLMKKFYERIEEANKRDFNPVGLHIRDPRESAFLFLEVEYF